MLIDRLQYEITSMKQKLKTTGELTTAADEDQRQAQIRIEQALNGGQPGVGGAVPPGLPGKPGSSGRVEIG
jgi:hypothetical protein